MVAHRLARYRLHAERFARQQPVKCFLQSGGCLQTRLNLLRLARCHGSTTAPEECGTTQLIIAGHSGNYVKAGKRFAVIAKAPVGQPMHPFGLDAPFTSSQSTLSRYPLGVRVVIFDIVRPSYPIAQFCQTSRVKRRGLINEQGFGFGRIVGLDQFLDLRAQSGSGRDAARKVAFRGASQKGETPCTRALRQNRCTTLDRHALKLFSLRKPWGLLQKFFELRDFYLRAACCEIKLCTRHGLHRSGR